MANLDEVVENLREGGAKASVQEDKIYQAQWNATDMKRKESIKRQDSAASLGLNQVTQSGRAPEEKRRDDAVGQNVQRQGGLKRKHRERKHKDHQAEFYKEYHKLSEEYDGECIKAYNEDLTTTLIFSGLFSAVTSAFIVQVDPQLQPDPNADTAALLRVLIYKIDNTTFGGDVPPLPQWTGAPGAMVHVQAILFASLAASLLSAFLAMLGKQWLCHYDSADMRGSAIERSQNRQRKLDGIVKWYFYHVMESLPLMLQVSLLLLGCALSRYLWEIDITIACVVLSVTSFGALFYLFIVVAGTVSDNCPYQTPTSNVFRYLGRKVRLGALLLSIVRAGASALKNTFMKSQVTRTILANIKCYNSRPHTRNIMTFFSALVLGIPGAFANDVYRFGKFTIWVLINLPTKAYFFFYRVHRQICCPSPSPDPRPDQQSIVLDLRCISWILQTSLDKTVRMSAFNYLMSLPELALFHPSLVTSCFDIFTSCINVVNSEVVTIQGLEELAILSGRSLFRTLHRLSVVDQTSSVLEDVRKRYSATFPLKKIGFSPTPFRYTMLGVHALFTKDWIPCYREWEGPPEEEQNLFAQYMAEAAQVRYQRMENKKIPRWILRFALFSLSLDPPSPPSVVGHCLTMVATDLDCDTSTISDLNASERVGPVSRLITQKLDAMVTEGNRDLIFSKRKAISTLFPYAICLERDGEHGMAVAISRAAEASNSWKFIWHRIGHYIGNLFEKPRSSSLNWVIALASPQVHWDDQLHNKHTIARWAAAVSAIPYTEEVAQCVVDALLRIAHINSLRSGIPTDVWAWLKQLRSFSPPSEGRPEGSNGDAVRYVRGLGDIEILKSYFLLIWSELGSLEDSCFTEMQVSIREDFNGIGAGLYRRDLMERLDQQLEDIEEYSSVPDYHGGVGSAKGEVEQYRELKKVLSEVDAEAM